jgi:hypothetical protein
MKKILLLNEKSLSEAPLSLILKIEGYPLFFFHHLFFAFFLYLKIRGGKK